MFYYLATLYCIVPMQNTYPLSEILQSIKSILDEVFSESIWIEAELADWTVNHFSGHAYGELVEHNVSGKKIASCRFTCWKYQVSAIEAKFQKVTGEKLKAGMKVKLSVKVSFSEQYGFAMNIVDIDPQFTLGDLFANVQKILTQLTDEQIIEQNRQLEAPFDFFNVAVISSPTAAGLGDFKQLTDELMQDKLCCFEHFDAVMQGTQCAKSVMNALNLISKHRKSFDCVVILRGGGSVLDLASFNDYALAKKVCVFKIPVFCAIGHDRDQCVLDFISQSAFGTPSKAAHHIQSTIYANGQGIITNLSFIENRACQILQQSEQNLTFMLDKMSSSATQKLSLSELKVNATIENTMRVMKQKLEMADLEVTSNFKLVLANSIEPTLKKGYAIALDDKNKPVKCISEAAKRPIKKLKFIDGDLQL